MKIEFNYKGKRTVITSDSMCYKVIEYHTIKGKNGVSKEASKNPKFPVTIGGLLHVLRESNLRAADVSTLNELFKEMLEFDDFIKGMHLSASLEKGADDDSGF